MTQPQTPYIGSKISLISMLDIRYEGILYTVNSQESTIALSKVRSFGTEDRPTLRSVPARDEVYEFIIFKASDIKDLVVCESPKTSVGPAYDPAIISVSAVESQDSQSKEPPTGSSPFDDKSQSLQFSSYGQQQGSNAHMRGGFGRSRRTNDGDRSNDNNSSLKPLQNQQQDHASSNSSNANYRQRQQYNNAHHNRNNEFLNDHRQHHNANNFNRSHNRQYHQHQGGNAGNNQQRERFKFDGDFDFEKANEKFKEQLGAVTTDLSKVNIEGDENVEEISRSGSSSPVEEMKETFYNKSTSFFDNISCEALEKTEGKNTRPDWKKERMTNQETFGHSAVRSLAYRRGQRGFGGGNGGSGNLHNRPSYQQQNYNNYNNNNNYQKRNYHQNQQQRQNYGGNQGGNYGNAFRQNQNQYRQNYRNQDHNQGNGRRQSQQNRADL